MVEEIRTDDYRVTYYPETDLVMWSGRLGLRNEGYGPIEDLLSQITRVKKERLTIDFLALSAMNSSGILVIFRFFLQVRSHQSYDVLVRANLTHAWQRKALPNVQRLMRGVKMEIIWSVPSPKSV